MIVESKIERITLGALTRAVNGTRPDQAWLETLKETYPLEKLKSQVRHTCPKWAFSILCHNGHVKGVSAGSCIASINKSSAAYALKALRTLQVEPGLTGNKRELKRKVFGVEGSNDYRQPNDEVEVILALISLGAISVT